MCAAQLTQVIEVLKGKINSLDQRAKEVVNSCKKIFNEAIKDFIELLLT